MSTSKDIYSSTAKNSIAELKNFIDGYTYGPLRALAQEPSQNSKDASASRKNPVVINYELIERTSDDGKNLHHYHLVVTDTGTTGLGGPVLTIDDLKNRGHILRQGEEWAAFEGMNYTKEGEDYLGSRGVGKRAFLYFSMPPIVKTDYRIIIYDTLLEGGEYRLGARKMTEYDDKVLAPPITGDEAQKTIKSAYVDGDVSIPLKLEPLGSVGTRVIVPYVDDTVIDSIRSGEFNRWLQLLWWRAIQVGELQINVIDDEGKKTEIQVPHWWEGMPWENEDSRTYVYEDISLEQGTIKRIVLFYDEDLLDGDIPGYDPQYCGVQLMRKRQWISTLDVQAIIPKDKRGGFRGFVEFSADLEKELRGEEGPTHEYFNKKKPWVREVHKKIENIVESFAEKQGWADKKVVSKVSKRDQELASRFLQLFTEPADKNTVGSSGDSQLEQEKIIKWNCELLINFPDHKSSRVNWGQSISNIGVTVKADPPHVGGNVEVSLEMVHENDAGPTEIDTKTVWFDGAELPISFGDYEIIKGKAKSGQIQCNKSGKWQLRAKVKVDSEDVASVTRHVYVHEDPPEPAQKLPQTVSVSATNLSRPGERRINNGDEVLFEVVVTNRSDGVATLKLTAGLPSLSLGRDVDVVIPGVPTGDLPNKKPFVQEKYKVYTPELPRPDGNLILEPGRYSLNADLKDLNGNVIAHSTQPIYFEVDPSRNRPRDPFEIRQVQDEDPYPLWKLEQGPEDNWILYYSGENHLYNVVSSKRGGNSTVDDTGSFTLEITAQALLEWSLIDIPSRDETRIHQLEQSVSNLIPPEELYEYTERLDRIQQKYSNLSDGDYMSFTRDCREHVSHMIKIFRERELV